MIQVNLDTSIQHVQPFQIDIELVNDSSYEEHYMNEPELCGHNIPRAEDDILIQEFYNEGAVFTGMNNSQKETDIDDEPERILPEITRKYKKDIVDHEFIWKTHRATVRNSLVSNNVVNLQKCAHCEREATIRCNTCEEDTCKDCVLVSHATIFCHDLIHADLIFGSTLFKFPMRTISNCSCPIISDIKIIIIMNQSSEILS